MFSSEGGTRTPDLRVMSPTSYQLLPPRNIVFLIKTTQPSHPFTLGVKVLAELHNDYERQGLVSS
jgi:hypothetical protein